MADLQLISQDEINLIASVISRERYMELRISLQKPQTPSIPVTSSDLANVINGRDDVEVPEWSHDSAFEAELESLITRNQVVWICAGCDHIVGFFEASGGMSWEQLTKELLVIATREQIICPFCNVARISLFPTSILEEGKTTKEAMASWRSRVGSKLAEKDSVPNTDRPILTLTDNERFLGEKLEDSADEFEWSRDTIYKSIQEFDRMRSAWKENASSDDPSLLSELLSLSITDETKARLARLSMRPQYAENRNNTLGRIWDSVVLMMQDRWPELKDVAIGIKKDNRLYSNVYRSPEGYLAIVINLGLFNNLYTLNACMDTIVCGEDSVDRRSDRIVTAISALKTALEDIALRKKSLNIDANDLYRSEESLLRSHLTGNAQQQFVILHELGHVAEWLGIARHTKKQTYQDEQPIDAEHRADIWAIQLIVEKGGMFHVPWMQYRSIFWLFEYWHIVSELQRKLLYEHADANGYPYSFARKRWDVIYEELERADACIQQMYMTETRSVVDEKVLNC
jgi:Zn-dependent peptidase ImmA (M78 family)